MKRTVKVSLAKVNNVEINVSYKGRDIKFGASQVAMNYTMFDKISRRDAKVLEPLKNLLITNPKTGQVTNQSLAPLVRLSNGYLANLVFKIGNTLNTEEAFSQARGKSGGGWVKPQGKSEPGIDDSIIDRPYWPALSEKYLYRIGLKRQQKGKLIDNVFAGGQGPKHFWYERRRDGSKVRKDKSRATGLRAVHMLSGLAADMVMPAAGKKLSKSALARENRFVSGVDIKQSVVRSKRGTVSARRSFRGRGGVPVLSVRGHLLGPSKLSLQGVLMEDEFSSMLLGAFAGGIHGLKRPAPAPAVSAPAVDYWLYNLLKNESRRGWIRLYSQRSGAGLHKYLGNKALTLASKKKL